MKLQAGFWKAASAAVLLGMLFSVVAAQAYTAVVITDPILSPLPSRPEPVLRGGSFTVKVDAEEDASGWSAMLVSADGNVPLPVGGSSYTAGKGWSLTLQVPQSVEAGLYDLNLAFSEGGQTVDTTQSRCVWALEEWPESLRLLQISDIHEPVGKDLFPVFVYEANLLNPDVVIATGDIVDVETIAAAWNYLQYTAFKLETPSYMLPGNHDYSGASSRYYQKYWGPVNYTVTIGDFLLITLSSTGEGYVDMGQLAWADKVLQENPDKVKIMAFHHPLLSSEYEDDMGNRTGGDITGSHTNMAAFESAMYPSWTVKMDEATELMRIIEANDVRLILSGHVHRDMIYILNGRHYFVTTTTIGGGLSPGSYHGYRYITIDNQGNVELDDYASTHMFEPPNSVPSGYIKYVYKNANDGSCSAVSAHVENGLNMSLDDARLEFTVSGGAPAEAYSFTPEPDSYTVETTPEGHRFTALVDVPANSFFDLTLSTQGDQTDPAISIEVADVYGEEGEIGVTIDVSDAGWGVKTVRAWYGSEGDWTPLEVPEGPTITGDEWTYVYPSEHIELSVPAGGEGVTVKVEAEDFAGNTAESQASATPGPKMYTLSVSAQPSGVQVMVNGDTEATPYSESLAEGTYVVEALPSATLSGKEYVFKEWGDGETSASRTVALTADASLTLVYEEKQTPQAEPSGGIPVPAVYVAAGLAASALLLKRRRA